MKYIALVISGLLAPLLTLAQPYGNEWIDHSLTYYSFTVKNEGIYHLDSATLAASGVPVTSIDPRDLMLFSRQEQQAIWVSGEDDGVLNGNDYIEFYAKGNDGWFDSQMWVSPVLQPNKFFSLYTDSIRYYLTWSATAAKKRMLPYDTVSTSGVTPRDWFWYDTHYEPPALNNHYYMVGDRDQVGASSPYMVNGEGWFDLEYGKNWQSNPAALIRERTAPTPNVYTQPGAPDAECTAIWAGTNNAAGGFQFNHHTKIYYGDPAVNLAVDDTFMGYKTLRETFPIPVGDLGATTSKLRFEVVRDLYTGGFMSDPDYPDYQAIGSFELRYPRTFSLGNAVGTHIDLPDDPGDPDAHIAFDGIAGTPMVYMFGDTVWRVPAIDDGTLWRSMVPADAALSTTSAYIYSSNSIKQVTGLVPVNGTGSFTDLGAIDPDSALLMVTHAQLMNEALSYASYREGNMTNPINTLVVDVDELFDQFGGGIPKHAFAIRRFCEFVMDTWTTTPRGLFLMGKSIKEVGFTGSDQGTRKSPALQSRNLVPTYGYPPSDPAYTFDLGGDPNALAFPVSRLSAVDAQDVLDYLDKVQQFEAQPPAAWMKRILHFAGGNNVGEQAQLFNYLEGFRLTAEDTCFGGQVTTFKKTSSQIIQQLVSDSLVDLINNGVTMMTFFAHASGSGFDINIDNPSNYDWNGHFPLIIGNSCYTGNIHTYTNNSASEEFVLIPDKGAIAFMASVDIGLSSRLARYTGEFYRSFSQVNYGKSIGAHQQYAVRQQVANGSGTIQELNNALTFTMHGDPSVVLNSWPKPEYLIEADAIGLTPQNVTTATDSFLVDVTVTNIGKAVNAPVNFELERIANNTPQQPPFSTELFDLYFQKDVQVKLPVQVPTGGAGLNVLKARVDRAPDEIPELIDELNNNQASNSFIITSGDLIPIYPYEYAIVPNSGQELKASTGDPFAPLKNYVFQIDTTDLFNSPVMESSTIAHVGGVVTWQPQNIYMLDSFTDSLVYYWRCSPDSVSPTEGYSWLESSFQYIPGKRGWGQAHFFQFKKDGFDLIEYDRPNREFDFFTGTRNVRCNVQGMSSGTANNENEWFIDLNLQEYGGCGTPPAIHVAVIDPATFSAWGTNYNGQNPDHSFGNHNDGTPPPSNCRQRVENYFIFRTRNAQPGNVAQLNGMLDMLQNQVPDGHHILMWSWRFLHKTMMDSIDPAYVDYIETLGASNIRSLPDSITWAFFVTKGDTTSAVEDWDLSISGDVDLSVFVDVQGNTGRIRSEVAGPATSWDALYWNEIPRNQYDSTSIQVIGITPTGMEVELQDLESPLDSLPDLEQYADASVYPYLRIDGFFTDDSVAIPEPAQMERWQLLYDPVPECAIDPSLGYYEALDSLFQVESAEVSVAIHNVSDHDMDSLLIAAWLVDQTAQRTTVHYEYHPPLLSGEVYLDTLTFSTQGSNGITTLIVEANPIDTTSGQYDQLEQYHFNNIAQIQFETLVDRENPLLDVTFDGVHILNGDIVSAKPEISMQLDDENRTLLMDQPSDTAYFRVFLTSPDGTLKRIYFRDGVGFEVMQFIPANDEDNVSQILYRPNFSIDGKYELQVQAEDVSQNPSGDNDYKIQFEVINRPTITEILNYPNPFTTRTQFVFTLTGSQVPSYMKIQIMTITGRVVREIGMHELGPLHVGRNITEYAWDGRDEFGDKLARGVYLYRVVAQLNGEDIEYRETSAGSYFKKGFGKMYLLR